MPRNYPQNIYFLKNLKYLKVDTGPRWHQLDLEMLPNLVEIFFNFLGDDPCFTQF